MILNKKNGSFILMLIFSSLVFGQENIIIKGSLKTSKGKPINKANISVIGTKIGTISNKKGEFKFEIENTGSFNLEVSHVKYQKISKKLNSDTDSVIFIKMKNKVLQTLDVEYKDPGSSTTEILPTINASNVALPSGNIEGLLSSVGFGVRQNNELSSGFNVRGGNFDENLIYVNGIEVYRPFLARSGQQEGLSFINPSMVENIVFSAGGFDAKYGDKLSSVLDISYREPVDFEANLSTSLLGTQLQFGDRPNSLINYNFGFRYRTNAYLLGALDTKGEYQPRFADVQGLINFNLNEKLKLTAFGTAANNLFSVQPENRQTNFGNINEALRFTVYYEGQENTQYKTYMGALSLQHQTTEKLSLNYFFSTFNTDETEYFDLLGEYRLDELERDLSSDQYGDVAYNRGVGAFLNHARNQLKANVINFYHKGDFINKKQKTSWGLKLQGEKVTNDIKEWNYLDSARFNTPKPIDSVGYQDPSSIPYQQLVLSNLIKANNKIASSRLTGFVQHRFKFNRSKEINLQYNTDSNFNLDTTFTSQDYFMATIGARANYWTFNNQTVFSPRINIKWRPAFYKFENNQIVRKNITFRLATGYYYQPPFYRAARNLDGSINPTIRAQKSIHIVAGGDLVFNMWDRKFKFGSEIYYKFLQDIIPYEIENVRVNYYGENLASGYARGIDLKINGEFVEGIQSYASLSWLQTKEDLSNDFYYEYFNQNGEKIIPGYTIDQNRADSILYEPGFIPRPTDQRLSFSMFFQDQMPDDWDTEKVKWSNMKVNINFLVASRLPYGPPGNKRYSDTLRSSFYKRVDIGFSKDLINNETDRSKFKEKSIFNEIEALWIAFEVFNLLDISNTTNYTWIRDVSGRQYSIPSFLTSRRLNLKLVARF
ncbi:MAG: TonB-dependent receptor [Crocinitomicaceae bacterium TMED135]|nr:MAG: TonB-dependent receptor [Crocinitomicaceae bacterium TMED135]